MLFNSYAFIFLFLPIALVLFHALRGRSFRSAQWALTLASLGFYSYWNPLYTPLLLGSVLANHWLGRRLARSRPRKMLLVAGIILNLALIGWFKYSRFLWTTIAGADTAPPLIDGLVLPLAISFFTFQQIAYLVDTWRGRIEPKGLADYLFFVTFFPQLIAGPIVRYQSIERQLGRLPGKRRAFASGFSLGLFFFAIGLFKKVVLADNVAAFATPVFDCAGRLGYIAAHDAWIGALAYSLQLYFDFSGYSDMALGLGRMFGFVLPVNFFSPYKATSIVDFWRRWHISLSRFFQDYVYIPLGGSRKGPLRQSVNLLVVMGLVGLWHGAGFTFVAWGLYHGLLLLTSHGWTRLTTWLVPEAVRSAIPGAALAWSLFARALTLFAVLLGWVLFRADSFATAMAMYNGMFFQETAYTQALIDLGLYRVAVAVIVALAAIALLLPNSVQLVRSMRHVDGSVRKLFESSSPLLGGRLRARLDFGSAAILGILLYFALTGIRSISTEFLYFNF